jgi:hypothetical protein
MRNYIFHFLIVVIPICLFSFLFGWWAEPIYGDLTRIGKWTERDFGRNAIQKPIQIKSTGRSLLNPDILVLGDSFAQENIWQSVVTKETGYAVQTFDYGKNCLGNFIDAAITNPSSKIIIIESVERTLIARFRNIRSCVKANVFPSEIEGGSRESIRPNWPLTLSLSYLATTAVNTVTLNFHPEQSIKNDIVVNAPLRADCAKFSNRRNDRLLYYADDDLKQQWDPQDIQNAIANILQIQKKAEQNGKKFIFVVAPDKSSVYQSCILRDNPIHPKMSNIENLLIASGVNTPNLYKTFADKINVTSDLYEPDNTHWSIVGYRLAGVAVAQYILTKEVEQGTH